MPTAGAVWWPSIIATPIQSFPAPSANANASTNTPTSSVRASVQASRDALPALWPGSALSGR